MVLSDMEMPVLDGFGMTAQLRRWEQKQEAGQEAEEVEGAERVGGEGNEGGGSGVGGGDRKRRRWHQSLYIMSGNTTNKDRAMALAHGADGFISKPIQPAALLHLVHSVTAAVPQSPSPPSSYSGGSGGSGGAISASEKIAVVLKHLRGGRAAFPADASLTVPTDFTAVRAAMEANYGSDYERLFRGCVGELRCQIKRFSESPTSPKAHALKGCLEQCGLVRMSGVAASVETTILDIQGVWQGGGGGGGKTVVGGGGGGDGSGEGGEQGGTCGERLLRDLSLLTRLGAELQVEFSSPSPSVESM